MVFVFPNLEDIQQFTWILHVFRFGYFSEKHAKTVSQNHETWSLNSIKNSKSQKTNDKPNKNNNKTINVIL